MHLPMELKTQIKNQNNVPYFTAAACLFIMIVADMIYGAANERESLLTWMGVLFAVLALLALFNERIRKLSFSKSGVTLETYEKAVEAAVNLGAAAATDKVVSKDELHRIAKAIEAAVSVPMAGLRARRVLWVDDHPQNNQYAINALKSQGIEVVECLSTIKALEETNRQEFDAIITDQLRYEGGVRKDEAGYELIRALRENGVQSPVILSTASPNAEDARAHGFFDTTDTQHGIFELAMKAVHRV